MFTNDDYATGITGDDLERFVICGNWWEDEDGCERECGFEGDVSGWLDGDTFGWVCPECKGEREESFDIAAYYGDR